MSFPDDTLASEDRCEICGVELGDEIVIQEFADGSLARLCPECAAGAALEALESYAPPLADEAAESDLLDASEPPFVFPEPEEEFTEGSGEDAEEDDLLAEETLGPTLADESPSAQPVAQAAEKSAPSPIPAASDPLDKTRELLDPVVDLITLQQEMQAALHRLAASLQVFASDVISEKLDKAVTVESRVEALERELELTRARLRETEALLAAATASAAGPPRGAAGAPATDVPPAAGSGAEPARTEFAVPPIETTVPEFAPPEPPPSLLPLETEPTLETVQPAGGDDFPSAAEDTEESPAGAAAPVSGAARAAGVEPAAEPGPPPALPLVPPPGAAEIPRHLEYHAFELAEVQIAQRYYNESAFTARIRDVRRSLGRPRANLTKLPGAVPRALLTIAWDIIWYQYLIDLRRDIPSDQRIVLHREGLDLDELAGYFKEKNASIDDEGRLDASELEVKLLSDPTVLLTEMTPEEEQALEDATEEIWNQRTAPEFKWDD
jgi:hypothetical protein